LKKNQFGILVITLLIAIAVINIWNPFKDQTTARKETKNKAVSTEAGINEGQLAPDFQLQNLSGESVKLSDYKGKKVILNFWASWCPPCKAEMPHMEQFYKEHKNSDISLVSVNLTNAEKSMSSVKQFMNDYKLTFPILLDKDGMIGNEYQAITIPTSYIIDSTGVIQKRIVGPMDQETMNDLIRKTN